MPISVIYTGQPMAGTGEDDFLFGLADFTGTNANTVNAGGGDDFALGDSSNFFAVDRNLHNNTLATATSLEHPTVWTTDENPLFGNSGVPHVTAVVEATIGEAEMFAVTLGAGQTITIDIDFGANSSIGVSDDLVAELVRADGLVLASNDDGPPSDGGLGSFPITSSITRDPYVTFTVPTAGDYYIRIRPYGSGAAFQQNATFLLNVSVTGHAVAANSAMGADAINGGDGDDSLFGQGGNDVIDGGIGRDLIHGGTGSDTVHGGEGNDTLHSGGAGSYFGDDGDDVIYAGAGPGTEMLNGGAGVDTLDTRTFNGGYEINLTTGATSLGETFVGFENLTTGNGADIVTGNGADNVIRTNGGNDTVNGLNGDDILWAGAGNDGFNGGGGIDTVDYSDAAAGMRAQLNSNAATNDGDGGADIFASIENLTGSAFDDILIGDGGGNVLSGGLGADTLIGLGGNDVLRGGRNALNVLQGGLGDDLYVIEAADTITEFAGEGTDTVESHVRVFTLPANVENLVFDTFGNCTGTGNAANNVIRGSSYDDALRGRGGVDVLDGAAGVDTADYTLAAAGVVVRLDMNRTTNDGDGATDTLIAIENIIGSNFNDVIFGDGADNIIDGGVGQDTLIGGGGNDILYGGSGGANNQLQGGTGNDWYVLDAFDTIVELAGEGVDTVEARVGSYTLGANVENLLYTGPGKFVGTGNALDNVITGGSLNDILRGRGGNDTINGGLGVDEVQLRGVLANYTITAEGDGYRIVDLVAGRDGSTFVTSVEMLRFANNTTLALAPVAPLTGTSPGPDESPLAALDRLFPPTGDRMLTLDPDTGLLDQPYRDADWM